MNDLFQRVSLSCQAEVGGEVVTARMTVAQPVWDDPEARQAIERHIRLSLMEQILKKWTPKITVRR